MRGVSRESFFEVPFQNFELIQFLKYIIKKGNSELEEKATSKSISLPNKFLFLKISLFMLSQLRTLKHKKRFEYSSLEQTEDGFRISLRTSVTSGYQVSISAN